MGKRERLADMELRLKQWEDRLKVAQANLDAERNAVADIRNRNHEANAAEQTLLREEAEKIREARAAMKTDEMLMKTGEAMRTLTEAHIHFEMEALRKVSDRSGPRMFPLPFFPFGPFGY